MGMNYLIARHGETDWENKDRHMSRIDIALNDRGRQQMKALGMKIATLQKEGKIPIIDYIYTSPMRRCRNSVDYMLERIQYKLPPIINENLIEHSMGTYDGKTAEEIEKIYPGFNEKRAADRWNVRPPKGENYFDVQKRVIDFLQEVKESNNKPPIAQVIKGKTNPTVLIMGHKALNKVLIGTIEGLSRHRFYGIGMPLGGAYYLQKMGIFYRKYKIITSEPLVQP